ncbi:MAG: GntR family transcriptional regulator [Desulfobacterales bacterium]|nr:GntR family transcriptional regulator [Desulfobacterales bacterium]
MTVNHSRSDKIHNELRMDILTGAIAGGTRLAESTLAKEKGVSRTPAREALQQLVKEGLLHAIPRAGYIVRAPSESDIMDLFKTRSSIERVAAQTALEYMDDRVLTLLNNNLVKTRAAIETGALESMIELDTEFHAIIYKATRSKYLYRICMNLSDYTLLFRQAVIVIPEAANRAEADHTAIYKAFKAKDPDQVNQAIKAHLDVVRQDILQHRSQWDSNAPFI